MDVLAVAWIARGLYYLLPNLAPFNVKAEVVYGVLVAPSHVFYTLVYATVYIGQSHISTSESKCEAFMI